MTKATKASDKKFGSFKQLMYLDSRHCPRGKAELGYYQKDVNFVTALSNGTSFEAVAETTHNDLNTVVDNFVRDLATRLTTEYPNISTYEGIFGGQPHLTDTRFAVSDVLSAFCIYKSLDQVIENLEQRYSAEQLIDALRFARDFLDKCYAVSK